MTWVLDQETSLGAAPTVAPEEEGEVSPWIRYGFDITTANYWETWIQWLGMGMASVDDLIADLWRFAREEVPTPEELMMPLINPFTGTEHRDAPSFVDDISKQIIAWLTWRPGEDFKL